MIKRKLIAAVSVTVLLGFTVFATLKACSDGTSGYTDGTSIQSYNEQEYSDYTNNYSEEYSSEGSSHDGDNTSASEHNNEQGDVTESRGIENTGGTNMATDSGTGMTAYAPNGEERGNTTEKNTESGSSTSGGDPTETVKDNGSQGAELTTDAADSLDTESGEGTRFVFTSVKVEDDNYDYYSYLVGQKGYVPIQNKAELAALCRENVLSLDQGSKNISYIITKNGLFDTLAENMENLRNQADISRLPMDIYARDIYLYGELGLDYQTYYSRGVAIFMIRKIQNVTNSRGDYSVYAVYYYSYLTKEQAYLVDSVVNQAVKDWEGTDYDKMLAAYDYLRGMSKYADNADESMAHTAYGALINKSAVCEGYAKAYKLLLDAMGISNEIIVNDVHAWNAVKYEEQWYVVDVTNGDVNNSYAFFMLGRDVLLSGQNMLVDGYIFTAGTIADYGYIDGTNTDSHTLAEHSLRAVQKP